MVGCAQSVIQICSRDKNVPVYSHSEVCAGGIPRGRAITLASAVKDSQAFSTRRLD